MGMHTLEEARAEMLQAITPKTSVVVITNPNNPSGTLLSYEEIEKFVAAVPSNVLVVLDEAYCEYVADSSYPNGIALLDSYPNLVVSRVFTTKTQWRNASPSARMAARRLNCYEEATAHMK